MSNIHVAVVHACVIAAMTFRDFSPPVGAPHVETCTSCEGMGKQFKETHYAGLWAYTILVMIGLTLPGGLPHAVAGICLCYLYLLTFWHIHDPLLRYTFAVHGAAHLMCRAKSKVGWMKPLFIFIGLVWLYSGPKVSVIKWTPDYDEGCAWIAHMKSFFYVFTMYEAIEMVARMLVDMMS